MLWDDNDYNDYSRRVRKQEEEQQRKNREEEEARKRKEQEDQRRRADERRRRDEEDQRRRGDENRRRRNEEEERRKNSEPINGYIRYNFTVPASSSSEGINIFFSLVFSAIVGFCVYQFLKFIHFNTIFGENEYKEIKFFLSYFITGGGAFLGLMAWLGEKTKLKIILIFFVLTVVIVINRIKILEIINNAIK